MDWLESAQQYICTMHGSELQMHFIDHRGNWLATDNHPVCNEYGEVPIDEFDSCTCKTLFNRTA